MPVAAKRVLVTDGEQRGALAVVRSLGRAGYDVRVCSSQSNSIAGGSRYCTVEARVPSALDDADGFISAVKDLCQRWNIDMLMPITDASLLALLPEEGESVDPRIPFPSRAAFRAISDKRSVLEAARKCGIRTPRQLVVMKKAEAARLETARITFPVIMKPSRSVVDTAHTRAKLNVQHAATREELNRIVNDLPAEAFPVMVQQRIVGPGVGVFLFVWNGKVRAVFAHRRLREKPPAGGVSVYCESLAPDPRLVARCTALLKQFSWNGVAMIEMKYDRAGGHPYLMEINGRFWGSLQLAIDAGVDFPALLADAAFGVTPAAAPGFRAGVRSRWWWGDVDHLITRLRRSSAELHLTPDAPSRMRAILEFAKVWRPGDRSDVFRIRDARPFLRETVNWLRGN